MSFKICFHNNNRLGNGDFEIEYVYLVTEESGIYKGRLVKSSSDNPKDIYHYEGLTIEGHDFISEYEIVEELKYFHKELECDYPQQDEKTP